MATHLTSLTTTQPQTTPTSSFKVERTRLLSLPNHPQADRDPSMAANFNFFDQTGFAPAVDAMPVWMFSRTQKEFSPCYPEGGTDTTGQKPNPGTNIGISASPGEDCMDPGPEPKNAYTLGNPFPTHDGILSALGHRHDWEGIVVKWQKDPEGDWWHRAGAIYNKHCMHDHYTWDQLNTVDIDVPGTTDVANEATGLNRRHPKVYVGFFSHASFPEINKSRKTILNGACPGERDLLGNEYRSNDWWRMPRLADIRPAADINDNWHYGDAASIPIKNVKDMCSW
ncbi:MAG: hypothetical protein Q9222_001948 [Ikaeria aurantiellina]